MFLLWGLDLFVSWQSGEVVVVFQVIGQPVVHVMVIPALEGDMPESFVFLAVFVVLGDVASPRGWLTSG